MRPADDTCCLYEIKTSITFERHKIVENVSIALSVHHIAAADRGRQRERERTKEYVCVYVSDPQLKHPIVRSYSFNTLTYCHSMVLAPSAIETQTHIRNCCGKQECILSIHLCRCICLFLHASYFKMTICQVDHYHFCMNMPVFGMCFACVLEQLAICAVAFLFHTYNLFLRTIEKSPGLRYQHVLHLIAALMFYFFS